MREHEIKIPGYKDVSFPTSKTDSLGKEGTERSNQRMLR